MNKLGLKWKQLPISRQATIKRLNSIVLNRNKLGFILLFTYIYIFTVLQIVTFWLKSAKRDFHKLQ